MNEKLVALAFVRASIDGDTDALRILMDQNPPSPALIAEVVTLAAGILEHGIGRDRALATVDRWQRAVLTGSATRARGDA